MGKILILMEAEETAHNKKKNVNHYSKTEGRYSLCPMIGILSNISHNRN